MATSFSHLYQQYYKEFSYSEQRIHYCTIDTFSNALPHYSLKSNEFTIHCPDSLLVLWYVHMVVTNETRHICKHKTVKLYALGKFMTSQSNDMVDMTGYIVFHKI